MFEYFAESNQGKEPLYILCNFYEGNAECRKNILQNEGAVFRYELLRQCRMPKVCKYLGQLTD